jgi:hypothetical protein
VGKEVETINGESQGATRWTSCQQASVEIKSWEQPISSIDAHHKQLAQLAQLGNNSEQLESAHPKSDVCLSVIFLEKSPKCN